MTTPSNLHRAVEQTTSDIFFWKPEKRERWLTEVHRHDQGQLVSIDSGSASMELDGATWLLLPGRVGWIPPGTKHGMSSHGAVSGWSMYLAPGLASGLATRPRIFFRSGLANHLVARLASLGGSDTRSEVVGRLLAVLNDEMKTSEDTDTYLSLPQDPRLQKLVEAFSNDPSRPYELDLWAREIGMSKRSLTRSFQSETGMNLGQWIQKYRIQIATQKMGAGADVTSAALRCGYTSVSAFIRAFKLYTGTTPAKYRRLAAEEGKVLSKRASIQTNLTAELFML